jgi:hypothetical protein
MRGKSLPPRNGKCLSGKITKISRPLRNRDIKKARQLFAAGNGVLPGEIPLSKRK